MPMKLSWSLIGTVAVLVGAESELECNCCTRKLISVRGRARLRESSSWHQVTSDWLVTGLSAPQLPCQGSVSTVHRLEWRLSGQVATVRLRRDALW